MAIACSPSVFLREEEDNIDFPFERPFIVHSLISSPQNPVPRRGLPLEIQKEFKVDRVNSVVDFIRAKLKEDDLDESFYVCNFGAVMEQFEQWERLLPRVQPFYAMKCNPSQPIVKILAALGTGFDCASAEEIRIAKELNIPNSKIIFANPCKSKVNILKARQEGIKMMTFDSVDELRKVHRIFPEATEKGILMVIVGKRKENNGVSSSSAVDADRNKLEVMFLILSERTMIPKKEK